MLTLVKMVVYAELAVAGVGLVGIVLLGMVLADWSSPCVRSARIGLGTHGCLA